MSGLWKYVKAFIDARTEEISARVYHSNRKYKKLISKSTDVQNEITANTPDEIHFLLLEYEDLESSKEAIMYEKLYKQGLVDGIMLAQLIEKIKKQ